MKIAVMTYRRGKTIVKNRVQENANMTLDQLQRNYNGRLATPEDLQQDKVELPGPGWRALKANRFYVAFSEEK